MQEKKILVANWKTYIQNYHEINYKIERIKDQFMSDSINFILCPPVIYLQYIINILRNIKINIGSQNISCYEDNTRTGEILASMIADLGCHYTIIGHSETRQIYNECTTTIALKVKIALKYNITPIICVGENLENRLKNHYLSFLTKEVSSFISQINNCDKKKLIIAYEPIWSINTNKIPSNNQIEEVIKSLKSIQGLQDSKFLYGGSINTENVNEIMKIKYLDGLLLGKASTITSTLINIYYRLL